MTAMKPNAGQSKVKNRHRHQPVAVLARKPEDGTFSLPSPICPAKTAIGLATILRYHPPHGAE
jgi:hypothetical protein